MKTYSTGVPIIAASISTIAEDGNGTVTTMKKGSTLSGLVLATSCCDRTIEEATVVGFVLKPNYPVPGDSRIYDGVSVCAHNRAHSHYGLADEVTAIDKILISIPSKTEDGEPTMDLIDVAAIKEVTATDPVDDGSEEETDKGEGSDSEKV